MSKHIQNFYNFLCKDVPYIRSTIPESLFGRKQEMWKANNVADELKAYVLVRYYRVYALLLRVSRLRNSKVPLEP